MKHDHGRNPFKGRRAKVASALTAGAALLVASGGGPAGAAHAPNHKANDNISGSIGFSWWGDTVRTAHTDAVIKAFERAYPKVTVNGAVDANFTDYWQKVTTEAAAGTLPCVTQTQSRQLAEYTSSNVFMNLEPLVKAGVINTSAMPKAVLDTGMLNRKLYMIPYGAAYFSFFFNNSVLRGLKLSPPPAGSTWEAFGNWLAQLRKKLPSGMYPIANDGQLSDTFTAYVQAYGQKLFNSKGQLGFSPSLLKQYWAMWLKWQKEKIALPESLMAQEGPLLPQAFLIQKKVVLEGEPGNQMDNAQTAADQEHIGNIGLMTYPSGPAGNGNVLVTNGLSIPSRGCGSVKAAAAFINFFTNNPAGAKVFASQNGAVTDTALLNQQIKNSGTPKPVKAYLRLYRYIAGHHPPLETYPPGFSIVFSTLFPQVFQKIADGEESLTAGVSSFMSQAKADLSA